MRDPPLYFFFSYAHGDEGKDAYLSRFFDDLREEVATVKGFDPGSVGFRDTHGLSSGDEWDTLLAGALQISKVLVCIYTARFFRKKYDKNFCAKEFAAFLKRNPDVRYKLTGTNGNFQILGTRNIIPILWLGESDLKLSESPPHSVGKIHYNISHSSVTAKEAETYRAHGLRWLYKVGPRKTRIKITKDIATSIVRAAEAEPLPSLDPPPKFEELWNAFYEMPNGGGPETATPEVVSPGPGHVLAVEVTTASGDTPRWTPYRGGPAIAATVEDIALQKWRSFSHLALDPSAADFEAQAWSALEDATKQQATPILFVDPRCLKIEQCRAALERLLQRNWNGGVIIPADGSDKETARLVQNSVATLAKYQIEGSRITIRESIGTIEEFGTAVKSIADDILATITEVGEVQQRPSQQADGPDSRPRITNVLTAAQGPDPASK